MKTMREKLLEQLKTAIGEERARILAKLVVLDEEMESKKVQEGDDSMTYTSLRELFGGNRS